VLVPCGSVPALADALATVLNQPGTRAELGRMGHTRAHEFSWENTARKTLECYRELVC